MRAAQVFDGGVNVAGLARGRPFEQQMLHEVRDAVVLSRLAPGPRAHPEVQRDEVGGFGRRDNHLEAVRQRRSRDGSQPRRRAPTRRRVCIRGGWTGERGEEKQRQGEGESGRNA